MRAIIIEEDRFTDLADTLQLELHKSVVDNTAERMGWDKEMWRAAVDEAHKRYYFHYVRWAQSHGATCVKK
jgi:ribosomal protein S18 acetylase RimI-like enzyme